MKKIFFLSAFSLLILGKAVWATPAEFNLPEQAQKISNNLYYLGNTFDRASNKQVEGYAIIHRKDSPSHREGHARGTKPSSSCYGFLSKGAKWRTVEPWVINATNTDSLDENSIFSIFDGSVLKWEDAADGTVGNGTSKNIMGQGSLTAGPLSADTSSTDGQNEMYFGDIGEPGTIGVTIVWGIFGGPIGNRQLVEWDQIYNEIDYDWSLTGEVSKMDFGNIAIHEIGHGVGLNDQYEPSCSEQTMFGYGTEGETKKQTLESADIAGVKELYK